MRDGKSLRSQRRKEEKREREREKKKNETDALSLSLSSFSSALPPLFLFAVSPGKCCSTCRRYWIMCSGCLWRSELGRATRERKMRRKKCCLSACTLHVFFFSFLYVSLFSVFLSFFIALSMYGTVACPLLLFIAPLLYLLVLFLFVPGFGLKTLLVFTATRARHTHVWL